MRHGITQRPPRIILPFTLTQPPISSMVSTPGDHEYIGLAFLPFSISGDRRYHATSGSPTSSFHGMTMDSSPSDAASGFEPLHSTTALVSRLVAAFAITH